MDDMLEGAYRFPRRLLRAFNYPGILLEFRHSGDSWSLAWEHTHMWVWGLAQAPSKQPGPARSPR